MKLIVLCTLYISLGARPNLSGAKFYVAELI